MTHRAVAALLLLLAIGCGAKKPMLTVERVTPTGLSEGDTSAVVLLGYEDCHTGRAGKKTCSPPADPASKESKFLKCLSRAGPRVRLVSSDDVRKKISVPSKSTAQILEALREDSVRSRLRELNYRYLILLNVSTDTYHDSTAFDGAYVVWMIGKEKSKHSMLNAVVWDLLENREAGSLRSTSSGKKGFVLPVVLVIPLPPVFWTSFTERKACRELGQALGPFLLMEGDIP